MFGNEVGVNGPVVNAPTNPFRLNVAGFGKTTDGEKAIDGVGVMGIASAMLPTLPETQTEDRETIVFTAAPDRFRGGDEAFLVENVRDLVVEGALLPELVNAVKHLLIAGDMFPTGRLTAEGDGREMAGDPDDF